MTGIFVKAENIIPCTLSSSCADAALTANSRSRAISTISCNLSLSSAEAGHKLKKPTLNSMRGFKNS
jgi:hypothetical protein